MPDTLLNALDFIYIISITDWNPCGEDKYILFNLKMKFQRLKA